MSSHYHDLPNYDQIDPNQVENQLTTLLESNQSELQTIVNNVESGRASWATVMDHLETLDVRLNDFWAPISHLNAVKSEPVLRQTHDNCIAQITSYQTELHQSEPLYKAVQSVAELDEFESFNSTQKKIIEDTLRDFKRRGVALEPDKKEQVRVLNEQLTQLSNQFQNNLLDSTDAWSEHISDLSVLKGLPKESIEVAKELAVERQIDGYVLTLDLATYASVMKFAEDRDLRERMYLAYVTRASNCSESENRNEHDNSKVVEEILQCRLQLAHLLGFENFAELSLDTKMAQSPEEVFRFINDLIDKVQGQASEELKQLGQFVQAEFNYDTLEPWDLNFATEKLRAKIYSVADQQVRPYFPLDNVVAGMFEIAESLFDIELKSFEPPTKWHDEVRYYEISRDGETIACFYLDPFSRPKKRSGAWMADCRSRREIGNETTLPVAYLTCNFTPPTSASPSLLSHSEVVTLFHEFGHGLHHMLTQQKFATVSGINGVEWDAVELPSQFMENWCWQRSVLKNCSKHIETGESLPEELLERLIAAKNLNSAIAMMRQLEFGYLDIVLHNSNEIPDPIKLMHEIRSRTSMLPCKEYDRFPYSFAHIFAGGYAAGYYSYLWAEVLSADAFAAFEEEGLDNAETGRRFREHILEVGSSRKAEEMFRSFRGRDPKPEALLRHCGIR